MAECVTVTFPLLHQKAHQCFSKRNVPGNYLEVAWGWSAAGFCISNKLPGDVMFLVSGTHFEYRKDCMRHIFTWALSVGEIPRAI